MNKVIYTAFCYMSTLIVGLRAQCSKVQFVRGWVNMLVIHSPRSVPGRRRAYGCRCSRRLTTPRHCRHLVSCCCSSASARNCSVGWASFRMRRSRDPGLLLGQCQGFATSPIPMTEALTGLGEGRGTTVGRQHPHLRAVNIKGRVVHIMLVGMNSLPS